MQLKKIIITAFCIAFLANVKFSQDATFQREKSDSEKKQLIRTDFENFISAVILSRPNQTGSKAAYHIGLPKPTFTASDDLYAYRLLHAGKFESSNVTTHEQTLVSLHCLLTL